MTKSATGRTLHSRMFWAAHSVLLLLLALVIGWDIAFDSGEADRSGARLLRSEADMAAGMLSQGVSDVGALFAAVDTAVAETPRASLGAGLKLLVGSRQGVVSITVADAHGQTAATSSASPSGATAFTRGREAHIPYAVSIVVAPEFWARCLAPVFGAGKNMDVAVVTASGRVVLPFAREGQTLATHLAAVSDLPANTNAAATHLASVFLGDKAYNLVMWQVKAPLLEGGPLVVGLLAARVGIRIGHHAIPLAQAFAWLAAALLSSLVLAKELRARRRVEERVVKIQSDSDARENFINTILENAPILVSYWDAAQRCQYANGMYTSWFNRTEKTMVGRDARDILGEALYAECEPFIHAALRGEAQTFEQQRARADGSTRYALSRYIPDWDSGKVRGFFVIVTDVTELKQTQLKLEKRVDDLYAMATTDVLTGLNNRRSMLEKIQFELELSSRLDLLVSFLMLDIDHFKRINDTFGHDAGDAVLRRLGLLLRETLRTVDHAGRLGGEEFGVLLTATGQEEAFMVAERLRKEVMDMVVEHGGETMRFTISIGLACPVADRSLEGIIKKADVALYQAKNSGRNRVCVAEDAAAQE